jgi:fido (protein-threonine AMPylation protein)
MNEVFALRSKRLRRDLLSVAGLKLLHQKMFDEVWKWAGSFDGDISPLLQFARS